MVCFNHQSRKSMHAFCLVSVLCGIVFGGDYKTSAFPGATIDRLHDVNHFLFVLQRPVDLVVVAGAQIYHYVLVPEEEHYRTGIVQLVHFIEVGHLCYIYQIDNSKIFHLFSYTI